MTAANDPATGQRHTRRGCRVTDEFRCPQGLDLSEHVLIEGEWLHPVLDELTGYWTAPTTEGTR